MSDARPIRFLTGIEESRDHLPVLKLVLLLSLIAFGVVVLSFFGFVNALLETDRSHISAIIAAIFVGTSAHCVWQTIAISRELSATRRIRATLERQAPGFRQINDRIVTPDGSSLEPSLLTKHILNLMKKARTQGSQRLDQTLLLRSLSDRLRSREKLGWFVAEALLRLALLGTAVGFIFMLIPIATLKSFDVETLRNALSGMSEGMAVALNVTVTGIGCALLLKMEYFLLHSAVSELFHDITEIAEIHVISTLERSCHG